MTVRRPRVTITGPLGGELVGKLGGEFYGIDITDNEGYDSDEAIIRIAGRPPYDRPPPPGTRYFIRVQMEDETGRALGPPFEGMYEYQTHRRVGDPESGDEMHLVCRAADFIEAAKDQDSGTYDEQGGFGTAGKIFEDLARRMKTTARIDPAIAAIKIPYRLRWRQSAIGFATDLADEIGGIIKPQMGMMIVRARGAGRSPSGAALPELLIERVPGYGYEIDLEPRTGHKTVDAPFFDPAKGRLKREEAETAAKAARFMLMHPSASEGEAKINAKAAGEQLARYTGTGSHDMPGTALAVGGAPVKLSGFGADADGLDWQTSSAAHSIVPEDDGWVVSVETQTRDKGGGGG